MIIGADEAGRGSLAGPIVGAAVCFHEPATWKGIKDSKQYTESQRERMFSIICKDAWVAYRIRDASLIDHLGIQWANERVLIEPIIDVDEVISGLMHDAKLDSDVIDKIADGNLNLPFNIRSEPRADEKYPEVGAASVVAKVIRDHIMIGYHKLWPVYGFDEHKGYYCDQHVDALKKYGRCLIHRRSYRLKALGEK